MNSHPNFTLAEFAATSHPITNVIPELLIPTAGETLEMLQRVRDLIKKPLIITSGYRCAELNAAVGGVSTSDHMFALAADVIAPSFGSPLFLAQTLASKINELKIGQLIYETTPRTSWVHLSLRLNKMGRVLTYINGHYIPGVYAK